MNRLMLKAALCITLSPLAAAAQQPAQSTLAPQSSEDALLPSASAERNNAIHNARTISVLSETIFLSESTLDRALLNQKGWDKLNLSLIREGHPADLEIQVNRVVFTHVHTYIVTDRVTHLVLASGRIHALDGVLASGPMAAQIVKALAAARLPATPASNAPGF